MFKKLRNRILLMNTITISIVIIAAFIAVYFTTKIATGVEFRSILPPDGSTTTGTIVGNASGAGSVDYSIVAGEEGNEYSTTVGGAEIIVTKDGESSYMYTIGNEEDKTLGGVNVNGDNSTIITSISQDSDGSFVINTLDADYSAQLLRNLLWLLLAVGVTVLAAVFFISLNFANRAIKPIEEAFENQRRFIADASHELKTPLMTIMSNQDVILDSLSNDPTATVDSQKEWLKSAQEGALRMQVLLEKLLTLSKAEQNLTAHSKNSKTATESEKQELHLKEFISLETNLWKAKAMKKSLNWEEDFDSSNIADAEKIKTYEEPLRQIIAILCENAVTYANEGGAIGFSLDKNDSGYIFKVENSGEGIPEEELSHIFERFYRADKARSADGRFGLGLSIAKALSDKYGFKLECKSTPAEMTQFSLAF
ncbi:MAG: HAMP domain-containing histidine kinase [Lachnospiraceae bacterium]|jgi:signal transduction histidine kinase|nr:HAMP domain-containing histidine kinase [Lachnospiraceae bacterium]